MPSQFLIQSRLLARDSVDLGRLVLNIKSPEQDFYPRQAVHIADDDITIKNHYDLNEIINTNKSSSLHSFLTLLFSAQFQNRTDLVLKISSSRCSTYQLKNSTEIFERICESKPARKWLEKAIGKGQAVYMIVGFQTLTGTEIEELRSYGRSMAGKVEAPVGLAPVSTGVILPISNHTDVQVGGSNINTQCQNTTLIAPDEQVYAVQYRKVHFSWFSSRSLDTATLKKNMWKQYWRTRASTDKDDIIEANLSDDDAGVPEVDGECKIYGGFDKEVLIYII